MISESARRVFLGAVLSFVALFIIIFTFILTARFVKAQSGSPQWLPDTEVTEVGKNAVRAKDLLDFTLATPLTDLSPVRQAWAIARNIAIALLLVALILFGFGVMLRRTETYRIMPYLPVVVLLIAFIFFSYPITNLIIQLLDIIQHYLVGTVRAQNLLTVNFNYDFIGYRVQDYRYNESAMISLFLTRATSFTYVVMVSVLYIRYIILWFLVIFSPFLSIALALPFTRNAGKIWIGEFFRWVLYGPVFAVFLRAVVIIWENGIPLAFKTAFDSGDPSNPGPYPTAISILLGGPGEEVKITNSLNYADTYAKYIIALLMLWAAIILPFILLRIFRDFLTNLLRSKEHDFRAWFSKVYPYGKKAEGPAAKAVAPTAETPVPPPPPPPPQSWGATFEAAERTGVARAMVALAKEMAAAETAQILQQLGIVQAKEGISVGELRNLSNIARFEMSRGFQDQLSESLNKIRHPSVISDGAERSRFTAAIRELSTRAARGDEYAKNVLNAAGVDYQKVLAEQGIKIAAVVGRPLGVPREEEAETALLKGIPTVPGVSQQETIKSQLSLIKAALYEIVDKAERGDKEAIVVLNRIATSVSAALSRVVVNRALKEGEQNRYRIIREEVDKLATMAEGGDPKALEMIAVVAQHLGIKTEVIDKFAAVRAELEKLVAQAEEGEERAISILNGILSLLAADMQKVISERIQQEGEEAKYQIIRQEVEKLIAQAEVGDVGAIRSVVEICKALELGFVSEKGVLINNEVAKIISRAEGGEEKSLEMIRTIISSFGFEEEREIKKVEMTKGFKECLKVAQTKLTEVIHRAEAGDTEAVGTLKALVATLGPDFEAELEKKKEEKEVQVSLEDYEQVKKMWLNNYRHAEVPADLEVEEREEWLKIDIQKLTNALDKITSRDSLVKEEGLKMISGILTFVLLGDFSETEIIAYIKAKLEAAKQVIEEIRAGKKVEEIEEELVEVSKIEEEKKEEKLKAATFEEEEEENQEAEETSPSGTSDLTDDGSPDEGTQK